MEEEVNMKEEGAGDDGQQEVVTDSSEVVQVIVQQDGQLVLPEGQFLQFSTDDGQTQYIQLTGEDGQNQFLQLLPNGQAQYIQVSDGQGGSQLIQVSTGDTGEDDTVQGEGDTQFEEDPDAAEDDEVTQGDEVGSKEDTPNEQEEVDQDAAAEVESDVAQQPVDESEQKGAAVIDTSVVIKRNEEADTAEESEQAGETSVGQSHEKTAKPSPVKQIDVANPIAVTSDTVVVISGKKCVLRVDPDSNHLVAYPFTPDQPSTGRKRGRPRKIRPEGGEATAPKVTICQDSIVDHESNSQDSVSSDSRNISEQENSAAEGLLGLSDSDGVRRSNRKRKKSKALTEYETGAIDGVDEEDEAGDETEEEETPVKRGRGRPPKSILSPITTPRPASGLASPIIKATQNTMQSLLASMGYPVKRGRGRPRRNPLPGGMSKPIPAFIIPSSGGQAVMMAPLQGVSSLETLQKAGLKLKGDGSQDPALEHIIIQNEDGTETQVMLASQDSQAKPEDEDAVEHLEREKVQGVEGTEQMVEMEEVVADADQEEVQDDGDAVQQDAGDADEGEAEQPKPKPTSRKIIQATTVIQLPNELVPLLLPKKDPVKIGLKATESDLEKLRCPKCDFQAYYAQQYQDHIATHGQDVHKCKCCTFLCFQREELLQHFKENHPKCICTVCDFTAEHAYIIKRHMLRHKANGCECEICGKHYKDQYVLKMHIKMVHMPAEVLYGCNICSKKFTRKAHLKRHLRIHEPLKPFKCPMCDYRGCEKSDITKHILIHDEPKHICEVCGKAFRHAKNKDLHVKRHKGQRDYKCGVCDFYGYTFTDIRKHIERKHSEATNKTVVCEKCGSAFKNDIALKEHQRGQCELMMIEQALAVAGTGGDAPTTIHIPASQLGPEGQIMVDGNQVNITVEHVALPDDVSVSLSESQMEEDIAEDHVLDESQVDISQLTVAGSQVELDGETVEMEAPVVMDTEQFSIVEHVDETEVDDPLTVHEITPEDVAMITVTAHS